MKNANPRKLLWPTSVYFLREQDNRAGFSVVVYSVFVFYIEQNINLISAHELGPP